MKILAIRGKNLASLAGEFEVDFCREPLRDAGLFAISGATGAGKSTLLDALCLALYGETPRLMQADREKIPDVHDEQVTPSDPRTLLRRGCGEGYAEVDFVGIGNVAYRARWSVRRARGRSDGKLQPVEYQLLRIDDLQPVTGTKKSEVHLAIVGLLGLSFTQFTRAVLLAQNDFATFLKADDNARAELLQTLTGSERFEHLSIRVYERYLQEKQTLDDLQRQLADAPPLEETARAELETALKLAQAAVAVREQDKLKLESALLWHQQLIKLSDSVTQAQQALDLAKQTHQAASERRAQLVRINAVEPARLLHSNCERLASETQQGVATLQKLEADLQAAERNQVQAEITLNQARQQRETAEAAQKQQQPAIELAKRLDTEIDLLAPQCQRAQQTFDAASTEVAALNRQLGKLTQDHQQTTQTQTQTHAWLAAHTAHARLAEDWKHGEYLLQTAENAAVAQQKAETELRRWQQAEQLAQAEATHQASRLTQCGTTREQGEAAAKAASERCARFDPEALAQQKAAAEQQRSRLQNAHICWTQWQERQRDYAADEQAAESVRKTRQSVVSALAQLTQQRPGLEGQLQQAERALARAQAACNQDVDALRATLTKGEACPVCGAADHPYAASDAVHRLHELLKAQQAEQRELRKALDALLKEEASQTATLKEQDKQLQTLEVRLQQGNLRRDEAAKLWQQAVEQADLEQLDSELAMLPASAVSAELLARISASTTVLQRLTTQEAEQRADQKSRDAALTSLNQAQLAEQQAGAAAMKAREAANQSAQAAQTAQKQLEQRVTALASLLDELESLLPASDWRDLWFKAPAEFRLLRQQEAQAWLKQRDAQTLQVRVLVELNGKIAALNEQIVKAKVSEAQTRAAWQQQTAQQASKHQARAEQLGGKRVVDVEAELARTLDAAQAGLVLQEKAAHAARTVATQVLTTRDLAGKRLAELQIQRVQADASRIDWLHAFNAEAAAELDLSMLMVLLRTDPVWLSSEREALATLDKAVDTAMTVLKERQAQHAAHLASNLATTANAESAATLEARLAEILPVLAAEKTVVIEREVALRQDDQRRVNAAGLIEQLRAQNSRFETWARLNEMIGSASGSKFRRIAQQYTLDVLLGYANQHLTTLSRRYQLERLPETLTLLVVDLDMGDEKRSVHSLSGGESFLVSLALALGLASLSAHNVKVESLFIDEGFGSLDADTLVMAMDALDKLQTQGRKVGVISHVHEMAERIGVQIQVRQQSGGQSRLEVIG